MTGVQRTYLDTIITLLISGNLKKKQLQCTQVNQIIFTLANKIVLTIRISCLLSYVILKLMECFLYDTV